MAPADSKDWLFAVAALTTVATSTAAADSSRAGVVTGAVASTRSIAGSATAVALGDAVRAGEELRTGPDGIIHILFLDQSSITLGPDSSLSIDVFNHDEASRSGKIAMTLNTGSVRVVGGLNSKGHETEVRTPSATVGILGGISIVETNGQNTSSTFLFGQEMRMTNTSGNSQTVLRPGFSISGSIDRISSAERRSPQQLSSLASRFEAGPPPGAPAGTPEPSVAGSQPGPGAAPLVSTSDRPTGTDNPGSTLAEDRLGNPASSLVGAAMSNNRPDVINSSDTPPPVNNVRTVPPTVTS
ncbi:FecR family protein [Azospirillum thermophilum]|uniref:FecR protein domain-containing protein n=1 Tax=Azospirillum thermophilum TaxID=2202148 RepID=A0A2S2CYN4_9PROT|nr:FecR domain-containing protein [Azospirillum thermophilum]AWK89633.1 hypothetical protein DEW08_26910 [Azospirillum thermophilum]